MENKAQFENLMAGFGRTIGIDPPLWLFSDLGMEDFLHQPPGPTENRAGGSPGQPSWLKI